MMRLVVDRVLTDNAGCDQRVRARVYGRLLRWGLAAQTLLDSLWLSNIPKTGSSTGDSFTGNEEPRAEIPEVSMRCWRDDVPVPLFHFLHY